MLRIRPSEQKIVSDGLRPLQNQISVAPAQAGAQFGHRPKRCACLVLRTSVGFKNPTYELPVCVLFFRFGMIECR